MHCQSGPKRVLKKFIKFVDTFNKPYKHNAIECEFIRLCVFFIVIILTYGNEDGGVEEEIKNLQQKKTNELAHLLLIV